MAYCLTAANCSAVLTTGLWHIVTRERERGNKESLPSQPTDILKGIPTATGWNKWKRRTQRHNVCCLLIIKAKNSLNNIYPPVLGSFNPFASTKLEIFLSLSPQEITSINRCRERLLDNSIRTSWKKEKDKKRARWGGIMREIKEIIVLLIDWLKDACGKVNTIGYNHGNVGWHHPVRTQLPLRSPHDPLQSTAISTTLNSVDGAALDDANLGRC